jgi:hypothetical protein
VNNNARVEHSLRSSLRALLAVALLCSLAACTTLSGQPRLSSSTLGCANAALHQKVPEGLNDKLTHCMAGGMIARHCSSGEAYLTGAAKEIKDLFTAVGDAEWADLRADTQGVSCARRSQSDAQLKACCERAVSR